MMQQHDVLAVVTKSYDSFADRYATMADTSFFNEYYERPAMFTLLGEVMGKTVLDVGCGTGRYSAWLVAHQAQVIAIDISAQSVHHPCFLDLKAARASAEDYFAVEVT